MRADKLCLAALSATLTHYLKDEALTQVPVWQMISAPLEALQGRATAWTDALATGAVLPGLSTVGGGSLPGEMLPTALLALTVPNPNRFLTHLRRASTPVIARVEEDRVLFDPRTVLPEQDQALLAAIRQSLSQVVAP